MEVRLKRLLVVCVGVVAMCTGVSAQAQSLVFGVGLSTPSESINDVYNREQLENIHSENDLLDVIRDVSELGYHGSLKYYFAPMDFGTVFYVGAGFHRFPTSDITIVHPQDSSLRAELKTTQNVVPLFAGFEYPLLNTFISPYIAADLQYTINFNSIDVESSTLTFPITTSTDYSRIGASIGAGIDVNAVVTNIGVDVRYNISNLMGREGDEVEKSYLSISLCVALGQKDRSNEEE